MTVAGSIVDSLSGMGTELCMCGLSSGTKEAVSIKFPVISEWTEVCDNKCLV